MRLVFSLLACLTSTLPLVAQEQKYRPVIDKGLAWLAEKQKKDGGWADNAVGFPTATTAFAGMALLADGHTVSEGKYAANQRRALQWFLTRQLKDAKYLGLLGGNPSTGRYMPEHGVAMSYMAKVYGEIEDPALRRAVRDRLNDAVAFAVKAQSGQGGWFYTSGIEGHNATENVASMVVLQGLLDARDAGIAVPKKTLVPAYANIQGSTSDEGGVMYSWGPGRLPSPAGGRPTITAMALAAYLPLKGQKDATVQRWLKFCAATKQLHAETAKRHFDLLPHYYFTRVVFHVDADALRAKLPGKKVPDHLVWAKYRATLFADLQREQAKDGSWSVGAWSHGPVMNTSFALHILLYENSVPIRLSR